MTQDRNKFTRAGWLAELFTENTALPFSLVYVCLEDDNLTLSAALQLHRRMPSAKSRIVMCLQSESGLSSLLRGAPNAGDADNHYAGLHGFSLLKEICNADLLGHTTAEMIAKAIHEDYKNSSANNVIKPWDELEQHDKESNRRAADHVGVKLRSINCGIVPLSNWNKALSFQFHRNEHGEDEVEKLAEMEHERWLKGKQDAGWTYSENNDRSQKKHLDCRPWDKLDLSAREKNAQQVRALPEILARAGYQIRRLSGMDSDS